ncbi:lecithin retinol acyltransferase family protein [Oscillatoria sp. FACHB-1406]|uniref:lecithin retinol acyltransferase family protein n=1 Tax=Oscillatoria sp. FACHB-1406 TaxID=2692846 RepID=UPI001689CF11|nr:lecithin retinol acyltransferase family protein [Oscillatoria sp. FACHB-1406]MBD2577146.1 lecithin retinol acyltransferase family protein [Oscillatoria sp. FACHB-1406]
MLRGDQIYVYREFFNLEGLYEHHGIDCGDGTVIHYSKIADPPEIRRTSIEAFSRDRPVYVREYQKSFIPDVVLERAESRLGERKYNLLFNNCEHFATWCKVGFSQSSQIRDFVPAIDLINAEEWYEPIREAIRETDPQNARRLLNDALAEIKVVWDDIQPRYKRMQEEIKTWQQVAVKALEQDREDLARAALTRKKGYEKEAKELEAQLQQLATMTENLLKNSRQKPSL